MTYSEQIGADRIKPGSIDAASVDTAGIVTIADNQTITGAKTLDGASSNFYLINDSSIENEGSSPAAGWLFSIITGDANVRFAMFADGKIEWGDGTIQQTNLYLAPSNALRTDGDVEVAGVITAESDINVTGSVDVTGALTVDATADFNGVTTFDGVAVNLINSAAIQAEFGAGALNIITGGVTGDVVDRIAIDNDGQMRWSDGTNPVDISLERGFAGGLRLTADRLQLFSQGALFAGIETLPNAAANPVLSSGLAADSEKRFRLLASGEQQWGSGSASLDAILSRSATAVMRFTVDKLEVFNRTGVGGDGGVRVRAFGPGYNMISGQADGAAEMAFTATAEGTMMWGNGAVPTDTSLYRDAAASLRTDGDFNIGGNIDVTSDLDVGGSTNITGYLDVVGDVNFGTSGADLVSFYGAAPVAQAAAIAAAPVQGVVYSQADVQSIADAVNDIIAALAAIGITA